MHLFGTVGFYLASSSVLYYLAPQVVLVVKNLPAHTGATGDTGSVAGLGGCPGGGTSNSLQYYSLGNSVESQLGRLQSMRWQE